MAPSAKALPRGFLLPDWGAACVVKAYVSTRLVAGVSLPPFDACNPADHVGDDPGAVRRNRTLLSAALHLPTDPLWLSQVHGTVVLDADLVEREANASATNVVADASRTSRPGQVLAVLTADCLPLLLCADDGSEVAAVHAGWRGLAAGAIEATVQRMRTPVPRVLAWLGPAIGPNAFEVGADVRDAFVSQNASAAVAFRPLTVVNVTQKWHCDLYQLARQRLSALGVKRVSGGEFCTFSDPSRFFSHRRDRATGRMASLIWIEPRG